MRLYLTRRQTSHHQASLSYRDYNFIMHHHEAPTDLRSTTVDAMRSRTCLQSAAIYFCRVTTRASPARASERLDELYRQFCCRLDVLKQPKQLLSSLQGDRQLPRLKSSCDITRGSFFPFDEGHVSVILVILAALLSANLDSFLLSSRYRFSGATQFRYSLLLPPLPYIPHLFDAWTAGGNCERQDRLKRNAQHY